jgi:hypothetical protein
MKADSKFARLVLVSPWPLFLFLVIPIIAIVSVSLHVIIPVVGSPMPLLINNICFALLVGCRLLRYLAGLKKGLRYDELSGKPEQPVLDLASVSEVRSKLRSAGFLFEPAGNYGEKRDPGYLGTTVMYAGLFILLAVGSWDNLQHFSGVVLDGMGPTTDLNKVQSYRVVNKGPLSAPKTLPRMQIVNQYLPSGAYPLGATEVILGSADGKAQRLLLEAGKPIAYGDYDIYMSKLVFEPEIVIRRPDSKPLFDSVVQLNQLVQKRGAYSFYGAFEGYNLAGGVYFQPETSALLVVVSRNGQKVVTEMAFQVDQQVEQGDFIISCAKMGQWSQIHVVHRRHKALLMASGLLALIGLLLRLAVRPQRVWLEERAQRCRVWAVGDSVVKLLK